MSSPSDRRTPRRHRRAVFRTFDSPHAADAADRAYWQRQSPARRLRELERLRQLNYRYGNGRPLPRFQPTLVVTHMRPH